MNRSRMYQHPTPGRGYEKPARPWYLTLLYTCLVVLAAAWFAHTFRISSQLVWAWLTGFHHSTEAAASLNVIERVGVVAGATLLAASIGRAVDQRWGDHVGIEAVAASARGEMRTISLRATAARAFATWIASTGLVSIGRESAIIESAGAVGAVVGRTTGGRGDAIGTAGIAAAFAAAYHAPISAILYVEEHLKVRRSSRAATFAVGGALGGHAASLVLFHGETIFPHTRGSSVDLLVAALIGLVPAALAARGFLELRTRVRGGELADRLHINPFIAMAGLAVIAGAGVAWFPLASGNGMDALREAAAAPTLAVALALTIGKLVGTTGALGTGAPGGVLSPTMAIASGCALLTLLAVQHFGWLSLQPWDAMVVTMAVGVAVGLRSPMMAVFLLPEMLGQYTLIPWVAIVVGLAVILDHGFDRAARAAGRRLPTGIYDEDA